ncbi:MAG: hypothetical protein KDK36_20800, partial [Leptospiraceae bacterium]|nr:hypothetical protein [Leptospiraceae bacterium]
MTHKITSFSFNFKPNKLILLLDIDSKELDLQIKIKEAEEFGVLIKPEYHFTILGDNTGKEILDSEEEEDKNTLVKKFQDLYNSIHWEISLLDEFYKLK